MYVHVYECTMGVPYLVYEILDLVPTSYTP
ncbi:hypothetical protein SAMN05444271_15316 [Halohasta litchfieldiae]|jgi:hypothetical protein|uniref:Uncharacterized protein n=1 Tax=Halohasta litchfieldiae TaxID=1073996 RepID=A0A1H6Y527_9EURY|nr:hypothetical protein SAMN05444271_15316 [Halohasta litchfieldiae]